MKKFYLTITIVILCIFQLSSQSKTVSWNVELVGYLDVKFLSVHPLNCNPGHYEGTVTGDFSLNIWAIANTSDEYQFVIYFDFIDMLGRKGTTSKVTTTKLVDLSLVYDGHWVPTRTDSDITFSATGSQIYYISNDDKVSSLYKNGDSWGNSILSSIKTNSGKGLVRNPVNDDLLFIGADDKIYKAYWNNGSWHSEIFTANQWNDVHNDSKLYVSSTGNSIFYINSDKKICHLYRNGSGWSGGILTSHTVSSGRSFVWHDGDQCVYSIGSNDKKIYKTYFSSGWRTSRVTFSQWNTAHQNSELTFSTYGSNIYYINSSNQVCNLYRNGSLWGDAILNSSANAKAKSQTNLAYSDEGLYYIGLNNYVCKLYYSGGWQFEMPSPHMALPNAGTGVNVYNGTIYFTGTDNQMHYLIPQTKNNELVSTVKPESFDYVENMIMYYSEIEDFNISDVEKQYHHFNKPSYSYENNEIKASSIDNMKDDIFSTYPNPVNENLHVTLPQTDTYRLQLIDLSGQIIYESSQHAQEFLIDCSDYKSGIYFINLISTNYDNINYRKKIIIQ